MMQDGMRDDNKFFIFIFILFDFIDCITLKWCKLVLACRRQLAQLFHRYSLCIRSRSRRSSIAAFGVVVVMEEILNLAARTHSRHLPSNRHESFCCYKINNQLINFSE